jgi:hypothetical protein
MKYSILFDWSELGPMKAFPQAIDTEGKKPVQRPPYRAGPYERRQIGEERE